jgi:hypothetical protein
MADWFYATGTEPTGPFDETALKQMFENGTLPRETQVWQAGMEDWTPASEIASFAKPAPPVYIITPVIPKKPAARTPIAPLPSAPATAAAPILPAAAPVAAPVAHVATPPALPSWAPKQPPPLPENVAAPTTFPPATFPRLPLLIPRWIKIAGIVVAAGVFYSCLALPWHLLAAFNYVRGQKAEDRKDYPAAAASYQASLRECPHSPVVLGRLGVVSAYRGDQNTLDWVNGELDQAGADNESDVLKARAAIAEALKTVRR